MSSMATHESGIVLPDQVWKFVFDFLTLKEISIASLVCLKWKKLVWNSLHELCIPNKFKNGVSTFDDKALQNVTTNCQHIRSLDLSGITGITDEGIKCISSLKTLRCLNVSRCTTITNTGLGNALKESDALQVLVLNWCTQFTDELFEILATNHFLSRTLQALDVSWLNQISDHSLIKNFVKFQSLRNLAINGCEQLSRKAINQMISHLPRLETIEVRWINLKAPRKQSSPLFVTPTRLTSSPKPLNVSHLPLTKEAIPKLNTLINSKEPRLQLEAAIGFRKLLSSETNPPIDQVIESGVVTRLISLLQSRDPLIQLESAWTLTNIASGTSAHTKVLIENGAVPIFVALADSKDSDVAAQAIWTLGNIAGDSVSTRDFVVKSGALKPLLNSIASAALTANLSLIRNATWCLSNLCRGSPKPRFSELQPALPTLAKLLDCPDEEVVVDACWTISYLSDGPNEDIDEILKAGIAPLVIKLLAHPSLAIVTPALRTVGNIATGHDGQTQQLLDLGVLPHLRNLLRRNKKGILKETCWTISNITAGPSSDIQAVFEADIMPTVVELLRAAEYDVRKEACWAIGNATIACNSNQIEYLVSLGCIQELWGMMKNSESSIYSIILDSLRNIIMHNKEKYLGILRSLGEFAILDELVPIESNTLDDLSYKAAELRSWLQEKPATSSDPSSTPSTVSQVEPPGN